MPDGTLKYAHRWSWELENGPIPAGLGVLHHCDNPPCINPAHLFLGTQADNDRDAWKKGLIPILCGEARSKLTEEQVKAIRASPKRNFELTKEFNIDSSNISRIRSRKQWRHI